MSFTASVSAYTLFPTTTPAAPNAFALFAYSNSPRGTHTLFEDLHQIFRPLSRRQLRRQRCISTPSSPFGLKSCWDCRRCGTISRLICNTTNHILSERTVITHQIHKRFFCPFTFSQRHSNAYYTFLKFPLHHGPLLYPPIVGHFHFLSHSCTHSHDNCYDLSCLSLAFSRTHCIDTKM